MHLSIYRASFKEDHSSFAWFGGKMRLPYNDRSHLSFRQLEGERLLYEALTGAVCRYDSSVI